MIFKDSLQTSIFHTFVTSRGPFQQNPCWDSVNMLQQEKETSVAHEELLGMGEDDFLFQ